MWTIIFVFHRIKGAKSSKKLLNTFSYSHAFEPIFHVCDLNRGRRITAPTELPTGSVSPYNLSWVSREEYRGVSPGADRTSRAEQRTGISLQWIPHNGRRDETKDGRQFSVAQRQFRQGSRSLWMTPHTKSAAKLPGPLPWRRRRMGENKLYFHDPTHDAIHIESKLQSLFGLMDRFFLLVWALSTYIKYNNVHIIILIIIISLSSMFFCVCSYNFNWKDLMIKAFYLLIWHLESFKNDDGKPGIRCDYRRHKRFFLIYKLKWQ